MISEPLVLHPCKQNCRILFKAYDEETFRQIESQLERIIKLGISEEQVQLMAQFVKTYKFHPKRVIAYGETEKIDATLLTKIIELDWKAG